MALVAVAFVAGSLLSGAGAVWANHQFTDVPADHKFHSEIDWMASNAITTGYADGTFKPTDAVSRQAFSAFLKRYNDKIVVKEQTFGTANQEFFSFIVTCPAGSRAIGGGGGSVSNIAIIGSTPTADRKAWRIDAQSMIGAFDPPSFKAYAICAPA